MTHPLTPREKVVFKQPCENCQRMTTVDLNAVASGSGDHAELARLAEAATPGPWSAADWDDDFGENKFTVQATEPEKLSPGQSSIWPGGIRCLRIAETMEGQRPTEDAAFIAAANPATVLALLAENAALRGEHVHLVEQKEGAEDALFNALSRATEAERKLAEAVGLLREWMGTWFVDADSRGESAIADDTRKFLSKEAERG